MQGARGRAGVPLPLALLADVIEAAPEAFPVPVPGENFSRG